MKNKFQLVKNNKDIKNKELAISRDLAIFLQNREDDKQNKLNILNEVDNFITITQNRVVYANEDDTNIFGFLLNDALSTNIDYGQIYLSLYKTIIKNIATKCKIN
jgi:hypothetical protein